MPLIRLGYVAMSLNLQDASPSRTVTLKTLSKLESENARKLKLKNIAAANLKSTKRILLHNIAHCIQIYRFSSKLLPLATYYDESHYPRRELEPLFWELGQLVREHHLRVSFHPDHFTVLSTPNDDILEKSVQELLHHNRMLADMGLNEKQYSLVLHLGGKYDSKEKAKQRFCDNFTRLPHSVQERIILENDDKIYHAADVLEVCQSLHTPFVFDAHHHFCNPCSLPFPNFLENVFQTWKLAELVPKLHFSTPKDGKNLRAHSDYIHPEAFLDFLKILKEMEQNVDIMLEAKAKDNALFQLMKDIGQNTPNFIL